MGDDSNSGRIVSNLIIPIECGRWVMYTHEKLCTLMKPIAISRCAMWGHVGGAGQGSSMTEVIHSQSACMGESLLFWAAGSSVEAWTLCSRIMIPMAVLVLVWIRLICSLSGEMTYR